MKKGDIILVPFPYSNLQGKKRRPAVVLYKGSRDVVVSFITSNIQKEEEYDLLINPSAENGLKKQSLIRTDKIATLDLELIIGKIGILNQSEIKELDLKLKQVLDIH